MGSGWFQQGRDLAWTAAVSFALAVSSHAALGQCTENNYVQDGTPSAQRDCQPLAAIKQLPPDAMSSGDADLVAARRADLVEAAHFYGFDPDASGWTYQQALSPLLRKHVLLVFTQATPLSKASHFTALVPTDSGERVQVVPAFAHGLHPYLPGWEAKGSYAVFNRLMAQELGDKPIAAQSDWMQYAVLYLTLVGRDPSIPTETDSVKANWDLSVKRGTTPVIVIAKNGAATISCSDLAEATRTIGWRLAFDPRGHILKAERSESKAGKPSTMQIVSGIDEKVTPLSIRR